MVRGQACEKGEHSNAEKVHDKKLTFAVYTTKHSLGKWATLALVINMVPDNFHKQDQTQGEEADVKDGVIEAGNGPTESSLHIVDDDIVEPVPPTHIAAFRARKAQMRGQEQ
jgi:hypothetical protein